MNDCNHKWREATIPGIQVRPFMYCDDCLQWLVIDKIINIDGIMKLIKEKQDREIEYMFENSPGNNPYLKCKHKYFIKYCRNCGYMAGWFQQTCQECFHEITGNLIPYCHS